MYRRYPNAFIVVWIASLVAVAGCSGDTGTGSKQTDANASGGSASDAGGAASGGVAQGGAPSDGGGGRSGSGPFCGLEACTGTKQCCASTGKCYDPSFEGCTRLSCTVTSNATGGAAGAANCCPMNLLHCASTDVCYHPACIGCCN